MGVLPNPHNPALWLLQAPATASAWACYRAKGINRTIVRAEHAIHPAIGSATLSCHNHIDRLHTGNVRSLYPPSWYCVHEGSSFAYVAQTVPIFLGKMCSYLRPLAAAMMGRGRGRV